MAFKLNEKIEKSIYSIYIEDINYQKIKNL